jgi:L-threonylcarbamoyladenylate synthase
VTEHEADPPRLAPTPENVARAADCVRDGGVVLVPGDTNVTFAVDPGSRRAVERVYEAKGRDRSKPLSVLVHDPDDWRTYGHSDHADLVEDLFEAFLPGPLNVIVERRPTVPDYVVAGLDTVCLGSFRNDTWRALAREAGPVAATSANRSGAVEEGLVDLDTAVDQVGDGVDLVLAGEGLAWTTRSTTILDLTGEPTVFREGDLDRTDLARVTDAVGE